MIKIRGFEQVSPEARKNSDESYLPIRSTQSSAGYDFASPVRVCITPKEKITIWSNVKAYMQDNEVLLLYVRSSIGIKKGLRLANTVGVIDKDYYNNESNEGNIGICLINDSNEDIFIDKGERISQGIFTPYLIADNGNSDNVRVGGLGSSGK